MQTGWLAGQQASSKAGWSAGRLAGELTAPPFVNDALLIFAPSSAFPRTMVCVTVAREIALWFSSEHVLFHLSRLVGVVFSYIYIYKYICPESPMRMLLLYCTVDTSSYILSSVYFSILLCTEFYI